MKLYVFIRRRIAVSAKKDGFKQHCFKQPCLICFFLLSLQKKSCTRQFESFCPFRACGAYMRISVVYNKVVIMRKSKEAP